MQMLVGMLEERAVGLHSSLHHAPRREGLVNALLRAMYFAAERLSDSMTGAEVLSMLSCLSRLQRRYPMIGGVPRVPVESSWMRALRKALMAAATRVLAPTFDCDGEVEGLDMRQAQRLGEALVHLQWRAPPALRDALAHALRGDTSGVLDRVKLERADR
jgi:hypothetical protein